MNILHGYFSLLKTQVCFLENLVHKIGWLVLYKSLVLRSVIDTKYSDGIDDPMEKIAIKSHSDHSDSGIGKMLILIDAYLVILFQCNKMTK